MDPCRPGKLCQTADRPFYLSRRNHHQVRQLVHDHDDLRQRIFLHPVLWRHGRDLLVISLHISDAVFREHPVPAIHLCHRPVKGSGSLLRIRDHGDHQMRDSVIDTQFHHLGVDHDKLHLIRLRLIQDTHDQCIDTHRFTGTCSAGNQYVRHLADIRHYRLPADILAHRK